MCCERVKERKLSPRWDRPAEPSAELVRDPGRVLGVKVPRRQKHLLEVSESGAKLLVRRGPVHWVWGERQLELRSTQQCQHDPDRLSQVEYGESGVRWDSESHVALAHLVAGKAATLRAEDERCRLDRRSAEALAHFGRRVQGAWIAVARRGRRNGDLRIRNGSVESGG